MESSVAPTSAPAPGTKGAMKLVVLLGVVSLFADMTCKGARASLPAVIGFSVAMQLASMPLLVLVRTEGR